MKPSMRRGQSGVALAVALILLVVLTLLALSGVRLSTMELRMSLNDEVRVESFEEAQSLVDISIRPFNNTPVLAAGAMICARVVSGCDPARSVTIPSGSTLYDDVQAGFANVIVRSIPPLNADPPVGTGYSLDKFDAAYLRVEGSYDKTAQALGQAQVNEGVAIVYGSAGEISTTVGSGAGTAFGG